MYFCFQYLCTKKKKNTLLGISESTLKHSMPVWITWTLWAALFNSSAKLQFLSSSQCSVKLLESFVLLLLPLLFPQFQLPEQCIQRYLCYSSWKGNRFFSLVVLWEFIEFEILVVPCKDHHTGSRTRVHWQRYLKLPHLGWWVRAHSPLFLKINK